MRRCPIFVFLVFPVCLLMSFYVSPGQVLRKPCLIDLSRLAIFGLNSSAWRYCASSGLFFWSRILFVVDSNCFIFRETSHIPVCLFLVLLLFLVHFSGLTYLDCLFLWCIHHHIRLLVILVGLFSFLGKCESKYPVCLGLVAGLLVCVMIPLLSHMAVVLSYHLRLWKGALLWRIVLIGVYLHLILWFLVCFYY